MSESYADLRNLYCNIMREIKQRQKLIYEIRDRTVVLAPRPAYEMCHLQMRMICELIAIGCLAAHGDIEAAKTGRIRSAYQADWILRTLSKLHPNFFPHPMKLTTGSGAPMLVDATEPYLTKEDVISIYHQCGGVLHRGNIETIGNSPIPDGWAPTILDWSAKLSNLIDEHTIILSEPGQLAWLSISGDEFRLQLLTRRRADEKK